MSFKRKSGSQEVLSTSQGSEIRFSFSTGPDFSLYQGVPKEEETLRDVLDTDLDNGHEGIDYRQHESEDEEDEDTKSFNETRPRKLISTESIREAEEASIPSTDQMLKTEEPSLSMLQLLMFGLPQFNVNFANYLLNSWLTFYYIPPSSSGSTDLISKALFGSLFMTGRFLNAFCDLFFGWLSDNTTLKFGRRRPFMLIGAPFLAFSFPAVWFPPDPTEKTTNNVIYFCFMFAFFNMANSCTTSPYTALLPELSSQRKERVYLATFSGLFAILGNLAGAGVGPLQATYKDGLTIGVIKFQSFLQFAAVLAGFFHLIGFWLPLIFLKEKPRAKKPTTNLFKELFSAFKNPAFISLIGVSCLLPMGVIIVTTGLPYLCTEILERLPEESGLVRPNQGETWVGILSGILVGGALLWFPFIAKLSVKFGKKRLMLISGTVMTLLIFSISVVKFFPDPAILTLIGVTILSLPAAISFVLPGAIYGDVVDFDEQRTGLRREGVYAGAQSFFNKSAMAIASATIVYLLALGDSRENPLGIMMVFVTAGIVVGVGTLMFATHPIKT